MGFTTINNDLLENKELNIQEQSLLIAIISFYGKGTANPSYKSLKIRSKIKKDETLIKTIKSLSEKGFIEIDRATGKRNNYKLTPKTEYLRKWSTPENGGAPTPKTEGLPPPKTEYKKESKKEKKKEIYISLKFIDDVIDKVKITQEQYTKLINKFNKDTVHNNIIALDNYIANGKGNKYKDHYRVLNTWCGKEKGNNLNKGQLQTDSSWAGMKKFN